MHQLMTGGMVHFPAGDPCLQQTPPLLSPRLFLPRGFRVGEREEGQAVSVRLLVCLSSLQGLRVWSNGMISDFQSDDASSILVTRS